MTEGGLAMSSYLETEVVAAGVYWNAAPAAASASTCGWKPCFAEMVITYSKSELYFQAGGIENEMPLAEPATEGEGCATEILF
jgi:hypothetical protein